MMRPEDVLPDDCMTLEEFRRFRTVDPVVAVERRLRRERAWDALGLLNGLSASEKRILATLDTGVDKPAVSCEDGPCRWETR